jgi:hypothetical protein
MRDKRRLEQLSNMFRLVTGKHTAHLLVTIGIGIGIWDCKLNITHIQVSLDGWGKGGTAIHWVLYVLIFRR